MNQRFRRKLWAKSTITKRKSAGPSK